MFRRSTLYLSLFIITSEHNNSLRTYNKERTNYNKTNSLQVIRIKQIKRTQLK